MSDDPRLPCVLLIGDSISIGYTLQVRELLRGVANVHRIPENGGSTDRGLGRLDSWLSAHPGEAHWSVIHFNWGLHDLKYLKDGKLDFAGAQVNPPEAYEANLKRLVERLEATGAALIFATTTPVPRGAPGRHAGDEVEYNRIAVEIMSAHGIAIDDLHAAVVEKLDELQRPNDVHFTEAGSRQLAKNVAESIRSALAARKPAH